MGKWGNGEMGKWGNGEMGKWGNGEMGDNVSRPIQNVNSFLSVAGDLRFVADFFLLALFAINWKSQPNH
jgi:hypothetical protein